MIQVHRIVLWLQFVHLAGLEQIREYHRCKVLHVAFFLDPLDDLRGPFRFVDRQNRQVKINLLDVHEMRFHAVREYTADAPGDLFKRKRLISHHLVKTVSDVIVAPHSRDHVGKDRIKVFVEPVDASL